MLDIFLKKNHPLPKMFPEASTPMAVSISDVWLPAFTSSAPRPRGSCLMFVRTPILAEVPRTSIAPRFITGPEKRRTIWRQFRLNSKAVSTSPESASSCQCLSQNHNCHSHPDQANSTNSYRRPLLNPAHAKTRRPKLPDGNHPRSKSCGSAKPLPITDLKTPPNRDRPIVLHKRMQFHHPRH
jgi:hypothetical protein